MDRMILFLKLHKVCGGEKDTKWYRSSGKDFNKLGESTILGMGKVT
jgi:hypothetical protein